MDFLKSQLTRIQEQLSGLSASQKMLTGALVAIMVMTLVMWSRYAAEPEMDTVFSSLSQDDVGLISSTLDAKGINYKVVGNSIMVPADQKMRVMGELAFMEALPQNFNEAFDDLVVKDSTPFDSPDKADAMKLEAKQRKLSLVIRNLPGVANAVVVIDPTNDRRFDDTAVQPSAMVTITTSRGGKPDPRRLANAAASVICGASAQVARSRVNVIVDGMPVPVQDQSSNSIDGSSEIVDALQANEQHYCEKIRQELSFISGLMVSVTVKLDTSSTSTITTTVDPKNLVHQVASSSEKTDDTTSPNSGGDPGATANTAEAITASSSSGGPISSSTNDETTYENAHGSEQKNVVQGPGSATVVAASVRVPRSYFVNAYKNKNNGKEPDDAALTAFSTDELAQIKQEVIANTGITTPEAVVVGSYSDVMPPESPADAAVESSSMATLLGGYSKEIGVGLLAAVSLFMVSMMVRKGAPMPALAIAQETQATQQLPPSQQVAGEVSEGNAMLDGMELDEDSVKAQQMVDQVQQMVETNPEAAANLVKRWLNR